MTLRIPLLDRNKDQGKRGRKAEKHAAKRILVPASGAIEGLKGDISLEDFLIESKSTVRKSISVKLAWLTKIRDEARQNQKHPALMLQFTAEDGRALGGGSWVAVPEYVFREFLKESE